MSQQRRPVDIEKLLQWAFRDELPKQSIEGTWGYEVSPMFRLAALGTTIDSFSQEPGFPNALGCCHPDAEIIGAAVLQLDDAEIDWPATRRRLLGPLRGLVSLNDPTLSRLTIGRAGLVAMHAKMGTRPRWDLEPLPEPTIGRNGKPVVQFVDDDDRLVEGRRGRHYGRGARCPLTWCPAPREAAFARVEYSVWHMTLVELSDRLQLGERTALAPAAPPAPWTTQTLNHRADVLAAAS